MISHDVTFDEDMALSKVDNLLNLRSSQEADTREPKEKEYDEKFAPVARYTTIHSIIALAASQGWNLHQIDVNTAFLHGLI